MKNLRKLGVSLIAILSLAGCTSKSSSRSSSKSSGEVSSSVSGSSSSSSAASSASAPTSASTPIPTSSGSSGTSTAPSSSSSAPSSSSNEPVIPGGVTLSFDGGVAYFASEGFAGVSIPSYKCASSSATLVQPDVESYPTAYIVKESTSDEMMSYLDVLYKAGWTIFEESSGYYADLYAVEEEGAKTPEIYIADLTNSSSEDYKGILIQFMIYEVPVSSASFPLEEVNSYLSEYGTYYGFTLSQIEADALSALSTSFVFQSGTDSNGYPIAYVIMSGEVASEALEVIKDTITAAGFTWDDEYEAYYNSSYWAIYSFVQESNTYLVFN